MADGVKLRHFLEYDPSTWQELDDHSNTRHTIDTYQEKFFPWTHPSIELGAQVLIDAFAVDPKAHLTADEYATQFTERSLTQEPKQRGSAAELVLERLCAVTFVYEGIDEHAVDVLGSRESQQKFLLTNGGYYFCRKLIQNERKSRGRLFRAHGARVARSYLSWT